MKPLFAVLSVALLLGTSLSAQAAGQTIPTDRSIQVYKKTNSAGWNRENAAGGQGPLLDSLAFTRHQTVDQDVFKEVGWLALPPGASIGQHKRTGNEDVYIIVSGKGLFTDSEGKQTEVDIGDIIIARPGRSHAFKDTGKKSLVFPDLIAETVSAKAAETR